jgi:hypothetical protein
MADSTVHVRGLTGPSASKPSSVDWTSTSSAASSLR